MSNHRDEEKGQTKQLKEKIRKWEVFPGRNRFYCNGLLMLSSQTGIFYFALFLIVATSACFFAMDANYLWHNVSPVLPLLAAVQCIFVVTVLCRTAFGDPGILPRASPAEAAALEKRIEADIARAQSESKATGLPYRPPPRIKEVVVNGKAIKLKYCYTCKIFRPPRASHCSVCDNCVDRFDHHCPWVGNCVGRRNYKYFFFFLTSLTIYCAYLLAVSVTSIVLRSRAPSDFITAMKEGPLSALVSLISFFSIWAVCGLAGFHSYLTCNNMTTNEDIKGSFKESNGGNPYSVGSCWSNCALVLCGPIPPSLIDRRGWVTVDDLPIADQHQGSRVGSSVRTNEVSPIIRDNEVTSSSGMSTSTIQANGSVAGNHNLNNRSSGYEGAPLNTNNGINGVTARPPHQLPPLEQRSLVRKEYLA